MPFELTESQIREHASSESFGRGQNYYRQGTVLYLAEIIESELSLTLSEASDRPAVETGSIRRRIRSTIHSMDYW